MPSAGLWLHCNEPRWPPLGPWVLRWEPRPPSGGLPWPSPGSTLPSSGRSGLSLGRSRPAVRRVAKELGGIHQPILIPLLKSQVVLEETFGVMVETCRDAVSNLSDLLDHGVTQGRGHCCLQAAPRA